MKKKNKAENKGIGTLLEYLDREIETFKIKNNCYPNLILMSQKTKDKLFSELENDVDISLSWFDHRDNYRGIKIGTKEDIFIELEE